MYEQSLRKYPSYNLPKVEPKIISKNYIIQHQKIKHLRNKSLANYLLAYTQNYPLLKNRKNDQNIIIVEKPVLQKLKQRKVKTQCKQLEGQFKKQLEFLKKNVKNLSEQLRQQKDSKFTEQLFSKLSKKKNSLSGVNIYNGFSQNKIQNLHSNRKSNIFNLQRAPKHSLNPTNQIYQLLHLQQNQQKLQSLSKKIQNAQVKKKIYYTSKHYKKRYNIVSKFKKIANAVLFVIYLKKYKERITHKKLNYFQQNLVNQINNKISKIKDIFTNSVLNFLQKISWKHQLNLVISNKDSQSLMVQKYNHTRKYINILIDSLSQIQFNKSSLQKIIQPTYFLCKHGNFGIHYSFYTSDQLQIMSVSEEQYVRADKNLQKSQIITLLFIKIFLFNMILRPWKMSQIQFNQKSINNKNLILMGGLMYRLVRQVQLNYLKISSMNEFIGNWKDINKINQRKYIQNNAKYNKIKGCKSMILQEEFIHQNEQFKQEQVNELIYGVLSKRYADQYYNINEWKIQRKKIINIVNLVHNRICHYHKIMAKKCF